MKNISIKVVWSGAAALLLLISVAPITATAADGPGSIGANYITRPVGSKSIAMGELRAALTGEPFNWLYNPASLQYMQGSGVGLYHSQWIIDTKYDNLSAHHRFSDKLIISGGFTMEYMPDIQGYDELGVETKSLKSNNYQALVGFGFSPTSYFTAGVNLKYFREKLDEWSAGGVGVDLGVLYTHPESGISLGLAAQNLGPDISFDSIDEPLPTTVRVGAGHSVLLHRDIGISYGCDIVKPRFEGIYLNAGVELQLYEAIAIRAGYCGQEYRGGNGISAGAGLMILDNLTVDYAWTPYTDLGNFHRISLYFAIE